MFVGAAFFIMAIFATLTSCISVLEAIISNCMGFSRGKKKVTDSDSVYLNIMIIALGYSIFYREVKLNGSIGQLLDIMDYISNSV